MQLALGIILLALSLLAWLGQAVVLFWPAAAMRFGLCEVEDEVEPAFWADVRGEALWDVLTLWTMVVAAILLIGDHGGWPYFGLIGGGIYLYFGGRGVSSRRELRRRQLRIGSSRNQVTAMVLLTVWALAGLATLLSAAAVLSE